MILNKNYVVKNRLIVDGVDIQEKYGLIMSSNNIQLDPPEPKYTFVDIPGRLEGPLDLSESVSGDIPFGPRNQSFAFFVLNEENFEATKTAVSNFLHGKRYEYRLTFDEDYIYTGRFKVTGYETSFYEGQYYSQGKLGIIQIAIQADPYKRKDKQIVKVNAAGGTNAILQSGRLPVSPVFECEHEFRIKYGNIDRMIPSGTHTVTDLFLTEGENEIFLNSYTQGQSRKISDISDYSVDTHGNEKLSIWFWGSDVVSGLLNDDSYAIYIQYDWKDL